MAEEGTIYRVGVGLRTLEDAIISLYGPYPEYDELHTAGSHENSQATSIFRWSPITDMVFVSVYGEDGTGDYSFFVQPVRLHDDHANIRGKGTTLAVGEEAWGELEFHGDVDAFRLDAEEGTVYEITVDLWTLDAGLPVCGGHLRQPDGVRGSRQRRQGSGGRLAVPPASSGTVAVGDLALNAVRLPLVEHDAVAPLVH